MLLSSALLRVQGLSVVGALPLRVLGKMCCHMCGGREFFLARARFTIYHHIPVLLHNKYEVV